jgi:hypothetical protein
MPDSDASTPTTQPSELEKLIQEAEAHTKTAGHDNNADTDAETYPPNKTTKCDHAGSDLHSRRWCRSCKELICQFCWSVLDSNYCTGCMQNVDLKVEETTLVDDEGVTHTGRLLTPSYGYNTLRWAPNGKTTAKALAEMSRGELEDFVDAYKQAVHEAEQALDFRRIRLSSAQLELDERRDAERRALRADKTKYAVKTVSLDPKTGKQTKSTVPTQKALDMLKAIEMLRKLKEAKAKPSGQ